MPFEYAGPIPEKPVSIKNRKLMESHTPGPWCLVEQESGSHGIQAGAWTVALVRSIEDGCLISAAPELLAVLEEAHRFLRKNGYDMSKVDKVIAKAKGEQA